MKTNTNHERRCASVVVLVCATVLLSRVPAAGTNPGCDSAPADTPATQLCAGCPDGCTIVSFNPPFSYCGYTSEACRYCIMTDAYGRNCTTSGWQISQSGTCLGSDSIGWTCQSDGSQPIVFWVTNIVIVCGSGWDCDMCPAGM